jgi:hypothetical protein
MNATDDVRVEVDGKPGVITGVDPHHIYVEFEAGGPAVACRPTSVKFVEDAE